MVNHGRSSACALCKQRRVRCDKVQPECTQCRKYGRPCPGVMNANERFFIINQGRPATQKTGAHAKTRPKIPLTPESTTASSSSVRSDTPNSDSQIVQYHSRRSQSPTIIPDFNLIHRLNQRIEDVAIAREYSGVAFKPAALERSGDGLFAKIYLSASPSHPVRHAIEAHALVKFSEAYQDKSVKDTANWHYAKALQIVQQRLNDPRSTASTDLGIAVWMMASYEYLSGDPTNFNRFQSHINGLLAMLVLRNPSDLDTDREFSEFFYTVTAQILPSFVRRADAFPRFQNGDPWLNSRLPFKGGDDPLDFFIRIGCGIVDMRSRGKTLFANPNRPPSLETCFSLIEEALHLDHLLDGWYDSLPSKWRLYEPQLRTDVLALTTPEILHRNTWPHYRHIYPHGPTADYLSHYYFLRLHVSIVVARASNILTPIINPILAAHSINSQLRLRDITDDFCASACTFFTYPGYLINDTMITLAHFKMCEVIPLWQRRWIDECFDVALERFGKSQAPTLKLLRPCFLTGRSEFGSQGYGES